MEREGVWDLKDRTREYALRIIRLFGALPRTVEAQTMGKQLLRSGTSPGANFREAIRARSRLEYATKLQIGLMELEETLYWLELLGGSGMLPLQKLESLMTETSELIAIFTSLIKRSKKSKNAAR